MSDVNHVYEEGIMEKIHLLTAPPQSSSGQKHRPKKTKTVAIRHGSIENNPYCDACGDGGDLLCCDKCPSSFHFFCCDPPMDSRHIPSGEWLCRRCTALPVHEKVPLLFRPLLEQACAANPLIFSIPSEIQRRDLLPGSSRKFLPQRSVQEREGETQKFCFICNKSGPLVSCDYCPLMYHLDCLDPPLTNLPTSVWMCPVHPHHTTPGFTHPRLTERLRAMAECREDVAQHTIKVDFIKKINRIPHYKRLTRHHNRRATEVPPAVKALYSSPLPDVRDVPPLTRSLLTPGEGIEWRRWEEERERREFAAPRLPVFTHEQDEWTKRTVLCQLEQKPSHNRTPNSPSATAAAAQDSELSKPDTKEITPNSTFPDFSVFLAAHKLLELSGRSYLPNGIMRPSLAAVMNNSISIKEKENDRDLEKSLSPDDNGSSLATEGSPPPMVAAERNLEEKRTLGGGTSSPRPVLEGQVRSNEGTNDSKPCVNGETAMDTGVSADVSTPPPPRLKEEEPMTPQVMETPSDQIEGSPMEESTVSFKQGFVPDISQLDDRLVHLLATQRVQQLFASGREKGHHETTTNKHLNGLKHVLTHKSTKPVFSPDVYSSAPAILCPVTSVGSAYPFQTVVSSIGTGSGMDICLTHYGHCNFVSSHHASVFFDKATEEYELLNYSEHGSVVDGVLYSCDFSDKCQGDMTNTNLPLMLDDITGRGTGLRAVRARMRLEEARQSLEDKEKARRTLEGALELSRPFCHVDESGNDSRSQAEGIGVKRTAETGSVVSIPLAKTKRICGNHSPPKKEGENNSKAPNLKCSVHKSDRRTSPHKNTDIRKDSLLRHRTLAEEQPHQPCMCKRSASSLVGTSGRGWEGTATLYHGSRVRFGCIQFVLSLAGRPGHNELVTALLELGRTNSHSNST